MEAKQTIINPIFIKISRARISDSKKPNHIVQLV
jgi:hypothetical protein